MEENNLIQSQICKNFIEKYPELKETSEEILKNFDLWKKNPCNTQDSFYDQETKLPIIFKKFNIDKNKKINYLDSEIGTTKNKFSISELTYENAEEVVKYSDLFLNLGYRVIICTYYGGYAYNDCTFSIEDFDRNKLFIDHTEQNLLYIGYDESDKNFLIKSIVPYNEDISVYLCTVLN